LTVDAQGAVWVALSNGGAVRRYTSCGVLEEVVAVPARKVTACTFGGPALDQLFITTSREGLAPAPAEPIAAYLALPSALFPTAVAALGKVGLPPGSRIVLEKPFGEDLDSAVALNALLRQVAGVAGEQAVFRVDHALGMATVQNLLAVRLANRILEPVWNSAHIAQVDLLWEETLGGLWRISLRLRHLHDEWGDHRHRCAGSWAAGCLASSAHAGRVALRRIG
jgi:Glucose-6-phosphate dehydrogenase, NAD binding domain/SMP-30/Gluconolactonase/LRE-like region/Glucose-6-phosphate dehydrogenase, C-terminal domain